MSIEAYDPIEMVDTERYPVADLSSPQTRAIIDEQRRSLTERGVAILPGFVRSDVIRRMARETLDLQSRAHLEDAWGTPYLVLPEESYPEGHPRRFNDHSLTWVLAYDLIPRPALVRRLYEWDGLMDFIGEVLERRPIYRMADPMGALNLAIMTEGHQQGWHYDNADFVVSLAIQSSGGGGEFECASFIRGADDEGYDEVARVLAGKAPDRVQVFPMTPGTLMIFAGRNSIHRVSPIQGEVPRLVALFAYDARPDANSSDLFKLIRYGRSTPVAAGA